MISEDSPKVERVTGEVIGEDRVTSPTVETFVDQIDQKIIENFYLYNGKLYYRKGKHRDKMFRWNSVRIYGAGTVSRNKILYVLMKKAGVGTKYITARS